MYCLNRIQSVVRAKHRLCCLFILFIPLLSPADSLEWADLLDRSWYEEQGVELPLQYGVGFSLIYMDRAIEVTDVVVSLPGRPESIRDFADFEVQNETTLSLLKLDAWVLPFLNVYGMLGQTRTDTAVSVSFEYDPPLGPPEQVEVVSRQKVDGPLYGVGATLVYGGEHWFCMSDANFSRSDLDVFEGSIEAWYLSSRIGLHGTYDRLKYQTWVGLAYLASARTLGITQELPVLGEFTVEIDQRPVNPWNVAIGASLNFNRHWEGLLELGSNFSDATVIVFSAAYRF